MAICALIMCMSSRSGLARYPAFRHSPPETVHNSHNELFVTFLRCDITLIHNPSSLIVPASLYCAVSRLTYLLFHPTELVQPHANFPPQIFDSDRSNPYPFAFVISLSLSCARGYFRRNRRIVLWLRKKKNLKRAGSLGVRV
ncbi:uncharacterized protein ASPGLDRAFT_814069 [Aspergillus glaucus CBS 516.65]|uniref:Uncharacterized protein n=1 Tax=Aspergillus glaucus CBS 516.65 TaxID=1160497 RepID=A0A1L9VAM4_ASPGL|nr:hypothetical protein ASPGLDRAFT_814069 [Aspergillus glaucus CBS 516.65]OJJ81006.1 hypothetical protein ASPGLDRAFT_814069 [Aspergillus glaucus CBS 516.65]